MEFKDLVKRPNLDFEKYKEFLNNLNVPRFQMSKRDEGLPIYYPPYVNYNGCMDVNRGLISKVHGFAGSFCYIVDNLKGFLFEDLRVKEQQLTEGINFKLNQLINKTFSDTVDFSKVKVCKGYFYGSNLVSFGEDHHVYMRGFLNSRNEAVGYCSQDFAFLFVEPSKDYDSETKKELTQQFTLLGLETYEKKITSISKKDMGEVIDDLEYVLGILSDRKKISKVMKPHNISYFCE